MNRWSNSNTGCILIRQNLDGTWQSEADNPLSFSSILEVGKILGEKTLNRIKYSEQERIKWAKKEVMLAESQLKRAEERLKEKLTREAKI